MARPFKVEFTSPFTGATAVTSYATIEAAQAAIAAHASGERMGQPGEARLLPVCACGAPATTDDDGDPYCAACYAKLPEIDDCWAHDS